MTENSWKIVAIILLIVISLWLLYFLVKGFIDYKYITLTKIQYGKPGTLNNLLKKNNIAKRFKKSPIRQEELTQILWAGYGKTRNDLRTVLSLANFPLSIYVCINDNNVMHLDAGLFKYLPDIHNLKRIESNGIKESLINIMELKGKIPTILVITVDEGLQEKNKKAYFELGEMIANISLKTRELKIKMKLIHEFESNKIMESLGIDDEIPIMVLLIGK